MTGRRLASSGGGLRWPVLALAALAGAAQCGTTGTPQTSHAFPVQEYTLPSGLKLVIERDDVSTTAGIVVVVDVGSVDDPIGKHGTAHVIEHLVFRVPDEKGVSLWNRLITLGAASFNAETSTERTTYHAFGPRQTLDELVGLVLARLADPLHGAKETHVQKELSITTEEMQKREGAAGYEFLMPALLPAGHPVGRAFAEMRRSDPLSLADVNAFANTFYRPERMTVVISGPVPDGWDKAFLAKLPPSLRGQESARHPPVRRQMAAFEQPPAGDSALPPHRGKVDVPELWMAWRIPPSLGVAADKASAVAWVLEMVLSSRLDPDGTNDVLDVDGFAFPGGLTSVVGCRFKLRGADDAVRIRNETKAAIEALSDATLVSIKGRLYWSHVYALQAATLRSALQMDTIQGRALARAELAHTGSSALISSVLAALEKVTSEDITEFAGRYLKPEAARSVLVVPEDAGPARRHRTKPTGEDRIAGPGAEPEAPRGPQEANEEEAPPPPPDMTKLVATTQTPNARAALARKLSNGLTVIAMRRPGLPFVSTLLGFHADPQPADAPAARYAYERVMHWELSAGPLELGLLRERRQYADETFESLRMFSASLGKALDFLAEEADSTHVYWPNPAYGRWLDESAVIEATPEGKASYGFRTALFGKHAYHLYPTVAESRQITEKQIQSWFERVRRPANGALVVVGEIDPEAVVRDAERALHGWKGDPSPPPAPPLPPAQPASPLVPSNVVIAKNGTRTIHIEDARRRTADVRFGCFLPQVRAPRDKLVNRLLSNMLAGQLSGQLRWKLAVNYSRDVGAETVRGGSSWISGQFDVDGRAVSPALDLLHTWLDEGTASPIKPQRFDELRWEVARRSGLMNATGAQLAYSLFEAWNMGWEPAVLDDYPRDLASITVTDLNAALETCRKSAVISVLGPDSPP